MNCSQAQEAIQLDLDGELSPPESRALIEHLADCPECRDVLRQHQAIRGAMSRLATVPFTTTASASTPASSANTKSTSATRPADHRRRAWRPVLAAAAAIVLCVCGWWLVTQMHGGSAGRPGTIAQSHESQPTPGGAGLAASQANPQVANANPDPRSAVRVEFDPATDVIALPKPTKNPNVTVLWIYPAVRTAEAPPRSSIERESNHEGVQS